MKLLLTGATGFVGLNFLLQALEEKRYDRILVPVRSPDKLLSQFRAEGFPSLPKEIQPVQSSGPDWRLEDTEPVDHLVHLAGTLYARTRSEYFSTNVEGTLNLLRQVTRSSPAVSALIVSSQSAAGPCRHGEIEKEAGQQDSPVTWYGESKLEMERQVAELFSPLNYLILRPPMILGARDQASLPLFKMANSPVRFKPGRRAKWYSFISVHDMVSAMCVALAKASMWRALDERRYFVSAAHPISDNDLIESAIALVGRPGLLLKVPQPLLRAASHVVDAVPAFRARVPQLTKDRAREIWPDRWVVSSEPFSEKFGWEPQEKLFETLKETHDWYVKTGQLA